MDHNYPQSIKCPKCEHGTAEFVGLQKGIDRTSLRWYVYGIYQCKPGGCESSTGDFSHAFYEDDGTPYQRNK